MSDCLALKIVKVYVGSLMSLCNMLSVFGLTLLAALVFGAKECSCERNSFDWGKLLKIVIWRGKSVVCYMWL